MKKRVAILISGGGSNMEALVRAMQEPEYPAEPVLVLSNVPGAGGLKLARAMAVPTMFVDHRDFGEDRVAFEAMLHEKLVATAPDIICLAGFMRILTPDFVGKWRGKMLNIHPSLLPRYSGLHCHARAIAAGDAEHGASVHLVTADLDSGPVLGQVRIPILFGDTAQTLAARLLPQEHRLYCGVLRRFAGGDQTRLDLS